MNLAWLMVILAVPALAFSVSFLLDIPHVTDSPQMLYLLSAVAQSLAAILALVFTISLIVAQFSSRYSQRTLFRFFDKPTIALILLFIASVFLPFWLLAQPNPVFAKASLILAGTCLFLLLPYFASFRHKINPEHMIDELKDKTLRRIKKETIVDRKGEINDVTTSLNNIIMSAYALKDYDTFEHGIKALTDIAYELEKKFPISPPDFDIYPRITDIGISTLEDPIAIRQIVNVMEGQTDRILKVNEHWGETNIAEAIGDIGIKAAQKRLDDATLTVVENLKTISIKFADNHNIAGASYGILYLSKIGIEAAKKERWNNLTYLIITYIGLIAAHIHRMERFCEFRELLGDIKRLEQIVGEQYMTSTLSEGIKSALEPGDTKPQEILDNLIIHYRGEQG
jgi:hypothetical protein